MRAGVGVSGTRAKREDTVRYETQGKEEEGASVVCRERGLCGKKAILADR